MTVHLRRDHPSAKFGRRSAASWIFPRPTSAPIGRPTEPTICLAVSQRQMDQTGNSPLHQIESSQRPHSMAHRRAAGSVGSSLESPSFQPGRSLRSRRDRPESGKAARTYRCDHCGYSSLNGTDILKHGLRHRLKSACQCENCSFSVKSASRLNFHIQRYHRNGGKSIQRPKGPFLRRNRQPLNRQRKRTVPVVDDVSFRLEEEEIANEEMDPEANTSDVIYLQFKPIYC